MSRDKGIGSWVLNDMGPTVGVGGISFIEGTAFCLDDTRIEVIELTSIRIIITRTSIRLVQIRFTSLV